MRRSALRKGGIVVAVSLAFFFAAAEGSYRAVLWTLPARPCPFRALHGIPPSTLAAKVSMPAIYPWNAFRLVTAKTDPELAFAWDLARAFAEELRSSHQVPSALPPLAVEFASFVWMSRHWTERDLQVAWYCGFSSPPVDQQNCSWEWTRAACAW